MKSFSSTPRPSVPRPRPRPRQHPSLIPHALPVLVQVLHVLVVFLLALPVRAEGVSQFWLVNPDGSPPTALNDGDQIVVGSFDFVTVETDPTTESVDFTVTLTNSEAATPPHLLNGNKFFDLLPPSLGSISTTTGLYQVTADGLDISAASTGSLTVGFEVIEVPEPPSDAPSGAPTVEGPSIDPIRVNVGEGVEFTDHLGNTWVADQYYDTSMSSETVSTTDPIGGTDLDQLYQAGRSSGESGSVAYSIPVPENGDYDIILHFCELVYSDIGERLFHIDIEGERKATSIDVVDIAGAPRYAANILFPGISVSDGFADVLLTDEEQTATIVALEVLPTQPTAPLPLILINAGDATTPIFDINNREWGIDRFNGGIGVTGSTVAEITFTGGMPDEPQLFQTYRTGVSIQYNVPVIANGEYSVHMYFMEDTYTEPGRIFSIELEGQSVAENFDIFGEVGAQHTALKKEFEVIVLDGLLNINFISVIGEPIVSAIAIEFNVAHLAHSVPGISYMAVDTGGHGYQDVAVDGHKSHTHALGAHLVDFVWAEGGTVLGTTEQATLPNLAVGEHFVNLRVEDNLGNFHDEITIITVKAQGFPALTALTPSTGGVVEEAVVTITGFGFDSGPVSVMFGSKPGKNVLVVSDTELRVMSPVSFMAIPVEVAVTTALGTSGSLTFTYYNQFAIQFASGVVGNTINPTRVQAGPDGKLYATTVSGNVVKWTLDANYNIVDQVVSDAVVANNGEENRAILGLLVDPFDVSEFPSVYISHSKIFHGGSVPFEGDGINGKISKLSGADLQTYEDIVVGLPVSRLDHAVNGLEMDSVGDLYILVGGNTNAGVPGSLSNGMEDNYFSSSLVVAHLSYPNFDGVIRYDANGIPIGNFVEVFASGLRNPFGVHFHSNGNLYGTDNGPNNSYGQRSKNCTEGENDPSEPDELNLLVKGGFYGHANRVYGNCVWRSVDEESDTNCAVDATDCYRRPLTTVQSSTNGIVEWRTSHFGGNLRKDLILSQYRGDLKRVVLSPDGESVEATATLDIDGGLDVTQGPDGTLFIAATSQNQILFLKPVEGVVSSTLKLLSVWPYRGPITAGNKMLLYGENFLDQGAPTVLVGGQACPVTSASATKVECTIPISAVAGNMDVTISSGALVSTLSEAYLYMEGNAGVTGLPTVSPVATSSPTPAPATPSPTPDVTDSILIDSGGSGYTDTLGRVWMADDYFLTGQIYNPGGSVSNTDDPSLYVSERWAKMLIYEIPVPAGIVYDVTLHFCEVFFNDPGKRIMDVYIQGDLLLQGLDIFDAAGGRRVAYPLLFSGIVASASGIIQIDLVGMQNNGQVSAIQLDFVDGQTFSQSPSVSPTSSPLPTFSQSPSVSSVPTSMPVVATMSPTTVFDELLIDSGGSGYTDTLGRVWMADDYFLTGRAYNPGGSVSNTDDPSLYASERWSKMLVYEIPVPAGRVYDVTLHFCEVYFNDPGRRVMDVYIQGELLLQGLDIFVAAGGARVAHPLLFSGIAASSGIIQIDVVGVTNNGQVSAVQVASADFVVS